MSLVPYEQHADDAESVAVELVKEGGPVDQPEERRAVYATVTSWADEPRRPIVPAWLRSRQQRAEVVRQAVGYAWYVARWRLWHSPAYLVLALFWSVVGVFRLAGRQVHWWWWAKTTPLKLSAIVDEDSLTFMRLHTETKAVRAYRGWVLLAELVALTVAVSLLARVAPVWMRVLAVVVAVPVLAHFGRPADRPIIDRVATSPKFVKLTAEMVRGALCSIGISAIKEPAAITFPCEIHRDGPGWLARVDLPGGTEAVDVLERRGKLSSALRLPVDQVWPSAGPAHAGQVDLWVGFQPASKMGQPEWALCSSTARASVFEPNPFGTDERQRPVETVLFARNYLIGGQPGSGKSFGARNLALVAALDPTCELKIAEFKGTGDFLDLAPLCSTYVCGVDDQAFADGRAILDWGLAEAERRGERIRRAYERGEAPDRKITPELARKRGSGLHPVFLLFDEVHELFGEDKEAGQAAERLIKRGRALGIIIVLATQIPDKSSLPPNITRCTSMRWCMSVGDQTANDMILGTGAYKRGLSATVYRPGDDAGWGIMVGLPKPGPVRGYFPKPEAAAAIVERATALRGGAVIGGTQESVRDLLDDVRTVWAWSTRGAHWESIAARLADAWPEYAGITAEAVSARLRALGVASVDVKETGGRTARKGARWESIQAALEARKDQ